MDFTHTQTEFGAKGIENFTLPIIIFRSNFRLNLLVVNDNGPETFFRLRRIECGPRFADFNQYRFPTSQVFTKLSVYRGRIQIP